MEDREMDKTYLRVLKQSNKLIDEEWPKIVDAYVNHEHDLVISLKISLKGESIAVVQVKSALEYYPEPKTKTESETVTVDEKQKQLFD